MKNIFISAVILVASLQTLKSQGYGPGELSINYNLAIPTSDLADFTSPASFRGLNFQYDYFVTDRISVGGYIGWSGFYEKKEAQSYSFGEGDVGYAINGTRYNYFFSLPIMLKGQYRFIDAGQILPYGALGIGTYYTEHETYIGGYGFKDKNWTFGIAPELGTLLNLGQSGWAFKVAAVYNMNFYNKNNFNSATYIGLNFGFNYDF
ncbi:MAG: outer membrane beta-barrel protein [Flavobacteriales bacterium]|nr:outer membrane beta-barrel protein [Flavobacteriales bacterium]